MVPQIFRHNDPDPIHDLIAAQLEDVTKVLLQRGIINLADYLENLDEENKTLFISQLDPIKLLRGLNPTDSGYDTLPQIIHKIEYSARAEIFMRCMTASKNSCIKKPAGWKTLFRGFKHDERMAIISYLSMGPTVSIPIENLADLLSIFDTHPSYDSNGEEEIEHPNIEKRAFLSQIKTSGDKLDSSYYIKLLEMLPNPLEEYLERFTKCLNSETKWSLWDLVRMWRLLQPATIFEHHESLLPKWIKLVTDDDNQNNLDNILTYTPDFVEFINCLKLEGLKFTMAIRKLSDARYNELIKPLDDRLKKWGNSWEQRWNRDIPKKIAFIGGVISMLRSVKDGEMHIDNVGALKAMIVQQAVDAKLVDTPDKYDQLTGGTMLILANLITDLQDMSTTNEAGAEETARTTL